MKRRLGFLVLFGIFGLACQRPIEPPPSPAPPSPPPPPNHAPVAVAGGPYTSGDGTVLFDGSASSDSDGDALTFAWNFGDGASSTEMKPSHTYPQDGDFDVALTVTDTKGAKSPAARTRASVARSVVFVGAGNIASGSRIAEATAKLLDAIPNATVFTTGDNAFPDGTDSIYTKYYAPSWGRHLARTRPVLGNHDYQTGSADGSFNYFGDRLGARGLGYYSYNLSAWHVIVLNDKGSDAPFLDPASPQGQWLLADLDANKDKRCTVAMWHVPLFVSSNVAGWTVNPAHKPVWDMLYDAGVDLVLNGQQHNYERFAPMTPSGDLDPARGIRQFNVGTGGESVENFTKSIHPNSEVRSATFGVLKLTLKSDGYDWQFVPVSGATFSDSGSGSCH